MTWLPHSVFVFALASAGNGCKDSVVITHTLEYIELVLVNHLVQYSPTQVVFIIKASLGYADAGPLLGSGVMLEVPISVAATGQAKPRFDQTTRELRFVEVIPPVADGFNLRLFH
jgi:hypothetical protein